MSVRVEQMAAADWPEVSAIYGEGIATGHATFASAPPESFEEFCHRKVEPCALVAREDAKGGRILGWAALSKVSDRCVYAGVAEVSIYVAAAARGRGVGNALLRGLIARSEGEGIWTLQAGIFAENTPSVVLHERNGFRVIGRRERIGKMTFGPHAGQWRDTLLLERRSTAVGVG